jgi:hypothetical protein
LNETSTCGLNTSLVEWSLNLLAIDAERKEHFLIIGSKGYLVKPRFKSRHRKRKYEIYRSLQRRVKTDNSVEEICIKASNRNNTMPDQPKYDYNLRKALTFIYLVYTMLPVSLDCPFLIALSVLSNVYLSCVHYVASFVREYRKGNQKWTI